MSQQVRDVVIIGGGTAGWLSAAYLNRAFAPHVTITLVESPTVPRIGVGEATVPTLRSTFAFLGMREEEWMPRCKAAFKSAVRFDDWRTPRDPERRHTYFHPFFSVPEPPVSTYERPFHKRFGRGVSSAHFWVREHLDTDGGHARTFGTDGMALSALCEANKAPKPLPGSDSADPGYRYAYHFDAALIAEYLRELSTSRGVRRVVGDVVGVDQDERGHITRVHTRADGEHDDIEGDLFIDCTGFRGLLINQTLKEPFLSEGNHLLCDSAVALPATHHPGGLRPYTTATARSEGWIWEIPLLDREGTGLVYSSGITGSADAEAHLRSYLGGRGSDDDQANHIRMRVGRNERSWVRNCIAIGLSSCFVEPLESSTIALIEYQLALLVLHFPDKDFDHVRQRRYNDATAKAFEDIRDFIVMHYCLTNRDDSEFWRAVRTLDIPDSLGAKFEEYASSVITPDLSEMRLFETRSIWAILTGMEFEFTKAAPSVAMMDPAPAAAVFKQVQADRERYLNGLPDHMEYLQALRAAATGGGAA